jgi:predicted AAA+ superfamily ATPase
MSENIVNQTTNGSYKNCYFQTDDTLASTVLKMTSDANGKFRHRDFVAQLTQFCTDNCYNGKIGIVYGLRSTGKTVGMLQVVEILIGRGYKAAYAHFNYEETGMKPVTEEIRSLASNGITHFFLDEASYLGGFINLAPDWSDWLVPEQGIKIIISGTDSFMLWTAERTSLFHRYEQFQTNWISFREYKLLTGKSFAEYKKKGGIFTTDEMPGFIQSAVVDNLLHTIEHCVDEANRTNAYTDSLYGIKAATIYKAVISIFKSAVFEFIKEHFIEKAGEKNIVELGTAISGLLPADRRDIKERVADSLSVYRNFTKVDDPLDVIESLIEFLVKIGCLIECSQALSDIGKSRKTYSFTHNALMNFAIEETVQGILTLKDINSPEFIAGIRQASEGVIIENIVLTHILTSVGKDDKVFKYRDREEREVDIVVINRESKSLRLIEVKSKSRINIKSVFLDEAKHLYNDAVLKNIGIDSDFSITRILAYMGDSAVIHYREGALLLINIEQLITHCQNMEHFLDQMNDSANQISEQ